MRVEVSSLIDSNSSREGVDCTSKKSFILESEGGVCGCGKMGGDV